VTETPATIADELQRYVRTGECDAYFSAWPGSFLDRARRAHDDLRDALIHEVRRRSERRTPGHVLDADTVALTRRKVTPMVQGLFARVEQPVVLATLERSVVFVTNANIEPLVRDAEFESSAWTLANLYLASVGAELLGPDAPRIVGVSEHMTCYVSPEYFAEKDPFADFVVHEAAHIFHNCKRRTLGLRETRTREWLLDIAYRKRETFAYACEAYARIVERGQSPSDRRALAAEYARRVRISEERVDPAEVAAIVAEAASARNGWKVILARCANVRTTRRATIGPLAGV